MIQFNMRIIARHEVGHLLSLWATGHYSLFLNMDIQGGNGTLGHTYRDGRRIIEYGTIIQEPGKMLDYEFQTRYILPDLVYFLGGGAIDNKFNCEDVNRNSIDIDEITNKIFTLIALENNVDNVKELKLMVYPFLRSVFDKTNELIETLTDLLLQSQRLEKEDTDNIISSWEKEESESFGKILKEYDALAKSFEIWLKGKNYHRFCVI